MAKKTAKFRAPDDLSDVSWTDPDGRTHTVKPRSGHVSVPLDSAAGIAALEGLGLERTDDGGEPDEPDTDAISEEREEEVERQAVEEREVGATPDEKGGQ